MVAPYCVVSTAREHRDMPASSRPHGTGKLDTDEAVRERLLVRIIERGDIYQSPVSDPMELRSRRVEVDRIVNQSLVRRLPPKWQNEAAMARAAFRHLTGCGIVTTDGRKAALSNAVLQMVLESGMWEKRPWDGTFIPYRSRDPRVSAWMRQVATYLLDGAPFSC